MSANSKIEWTDHTFNPWEGCQKVGTGCDHCYAETRNARFGGGQAINWGAGAPRRRTSVSNWQKPLAWNRAHEAFFVEHGRRQRVFCASLADVFDNAVDPVWRADLFRLIEATPDLDWLLLTKRIGNVPGMMIEVAQHLSWMEHLETARLPANVWLGATVVNQREADRDIPRLLQMPAAKRFLSMEPLLGPVNLQCVKWTESERGFLDATTGETTCMQHPSSDRWASNLPALDWVIVGGESGANARPMSILWAREVRDQCVASGVPFLFKQWGEWAPAGVVPAETQGRYAFGDYDYDQTMFIQTDHYPRMFMRYGARCVLERVGKKMAGRLLDGLEWNEAPK